MTRDDIIRMAIESDVITGQLKRWTFEKIEHLERFFKAAYTAGAAAERARMCEQFDIPKELAHEKAKGNETN